MGKVLRRVLFLAGCLFTCVMLVQGGARASQVARNYPPATIVGLRAGDAFRTTSSSLSRTVTYSFDVVNDSNRAVFLRVAARSGGDMTVVRNASYDALRMIPPKSSRQVTVAYHIGKCSHRMRGDWPIPFDVGRSQSTETRVSLSPPLAGKLQWQEYLVDLICR